MNVKRLLLWLALLILIPTLSQSEPELSMDSQGRWVNSQGGNIYGDSRFNLNADPRFNLNADPRFNLNADPRFNLNANPRFNLNADPSFNMNGDIR